MRKPILYIVVLMPPLFCLAEYDSKALNHLETKIERLEREQSNVRNQISRETSSLERRTSILDSKGMNRIASTRGEHTLDRNHPEGPAV